MTKRAAAEFIGTFWLVFGGCGSAILAAAFPALGIGFVGVSLAFGLTVLSMAYAIGHISGCHLNPAVSIGLFTGGRFPASELLPYIIAQVAGAGVLFVIASGKTGFAGPAGPTLPSAGVSVRWPTRSKNRERSERISRIPEAEDVTPPVRAGILAMFTYAA